MTQNELKQILKYEPETGYFEWLIDVPPAKVYIGRIAGTMDNNGYIIIRYKRKAYKAHRLAWLYVYGELPLRMIDHINRNVADNRITNLREASNSQNAANSKNTHNTKTNMLGVYNEYKDTYRVRIMVKGKRLNLGTFKNFEDACEIYKQASVKYFGSFSVFA